MSLKKQYSRFRAWQKGPRHYSGQGLEEHHCPNCDHDFTGNFCPVCGQAAGDGRITWEWVRKSIMLLWGMESRSMPYTLWQLIWRPGYLIGEYISGRRQVSYPPVKMLFIVVALYAIVKLLFGIETPGKDLGEDPSKVILIIDWLIMHPAWGMMAMSILMILPTWVLFRFAPRHTKHSLPEGIIIQLFLCTILLLVIILTRYLSAWISLLIPFYLYFTYRQLFGYGIWGTFWHTLLCLLIWVMSLLLIIALISTFGFGFDRTSFMTTCVLLAALSVILVVGYWIGKRNYRSQPADNQ